MKNSSNPPFVTVADSPYGINLLVGAIIRLPTRKKYGCSSNFIVKSKTRA